MKREKFEELVEKAFNNLPETFLNKVDNVRISIEDFPSTEQLRSVHSHSQYELLGLYEGIPLEKRGVWYGTSPTLPDRIVLFQKNIEAVCRTEREIEEKIHEVLIHEIGHYFGMSEEEIRAAGF